MSFKKTLKLPELKSFKACQDSVRFLQNKIREMDVFSVMSLSEMRYIFLPKPNPSESFLVFNKLEPWANELAFVPLKVSISLRVRVYPTPEIKCIQRTR